LLRLRLPIRAGWLAGAKKAAFVVDFWRGAVCSGWRSEFSMRLWSKWLVANWIPLRGALGPALILAIFFETLFWPLAGGSRFAWWILTASPGLH
jgi:hypothetical protein